MTPEQHQQSATDGSFNQTYWNNSTFVSVGNTAARMTAAKAHDMGKNCCFSEFIVIIFNIEHNFIESHLHG
jgi:hypothetical protein